FQESSFPFPGVLEAKYRTYEEVPDDASGGVGFVVPFQGGADDELHVTTKDQYHWFGDVFLIQSEDGFRFFLKVLFLYFDFYKQDVLVVHRSGMLRWNMAQVGSQTPGHGRTDR